MTDQPGIQIPTQNCPFCHPEPERIIARLDLALVIWDLYPVSPGHALIVPLRHHASWAGLTHGERVALVEGIDIARTAIEQRHTPDGYNIGINDGEAAGQTVMHAHVHVIPRYEGDSPDPRGGIRWVVPAKAGRWKADKNGV